MNIEDTLPGSFAFAPDADDGVKCELNTQDLKTITKRLRVALNDDSNEDMGYDPYNTGAHPRFTRR